MTIADLERRAGQPDDVLEVKTVGTNVGTEDATGVDLRSALPRDTALLPDTLRVVSGEGAGPQTVDADADRATSDEAARTITWRLGALPGQSVPVRAGYAVRHHVRVVAPANGSSPSRPRPRATRASRRTRGTRSTTSRRP